MTRRRLTLLGTRGMLNAVARLMHEEEEPSDASAEVPSGADPLVGKTLAGRFEIEALIARGGMGKIYKATQQPLGRKVALKALDIVDDGDGGEFRKRFFLEASLCAKLTHPHTVRIFDYGCSEDGVYFIAMEFLEGATLAQLIHQAAPLAPLRAIRISRQICGALHEAHQRGIIHRDLKPANVFVTSQGDEGDFVKVVDFGLVKEMGLDSELSKTGHVLGSPMYMSPEQVNNDRVDQRTDIYAMGVILYAMLTGRTPFKKANMLAVLMAQIHKPVPSFSDAAPDLKLPASLEWVTLAALQKDREKRFATMGEFSRALKACEKELRKEFPSPLQLRLEDGLVVLPEGLEVSEDMRLSESATKRLERPAGPDFVASTLNLPNPLAPSAGLRMLQIVAIAVGLLLVVAVAGGVGAAMTGYLQPAAEVAPPPAAALPPPPQSSDAPVRQEVHLTSDPSGAEVERDGVYLGATPLTLQIPVGGEWIVTVQAEGHQPRTVRLAADQKDLDVRLERIPAKRQVGPLVPATPLPEPSTESSTEQPPESKPKPSTDLRNPWEKRP